VAQTSTREITGLPRAWCDGDQAVLNKLTPLVYDELQRLYYRRMPRERGGHTLQTSPLLNEAYLRLIEGQAVYWQSRGHLFRSWR
jgi:hypothetical protein